MKKQTDAINLTLVSFMSGFNLTALFYRPNLVSAAFFVFFTARMIFKTIELYKRDVGN